MEDLGDLFEGLAEVGLGISDKADDFEPHPDYDTLAPDAEGLPDIEDTPPEGVKGAPGCLPHLQGEDSALPPMSFATLARFVGSVIRWLDTGDFHEPVPGRVQWGSPEDDRSQVPGQPRD
ncbi:MAG TPA: hypothetical protein VFM05_00910 [Candidatus Saccharimonadales bacterium]|nr:hypothetical protein [Candidatus Saccharimonadales bacterium]